MEAKLWESAEWYTSIEEAARNIQYHVLVEAFSQVIKHMLAGLGMD